MYKIELEQFQGPLDLLLQLIEGQKLDISQISLAGVTDQYLSYLETAREISAEDLADFLVVATKLLVIKSKILLPQLADEEEDSAEQLEAQLKMYQDYLVVVKKLEAIISEGSFNFSRERLATDLNPTFSPPKNLKIHDLSLVFQEVVKRVDYIVNLPQKVMARVVTLKEKILNLRDALKKCKRLNFNQILTNTQSRTEIVVSFIALLELIKAGEVAVNQKGVFDEIVIESVKL